MPPAKHPPERRKRSGAWFVSPPPNWPLDDLTVLREVDGDTGVELLLALYNTRLISAAPPAVRDQLFRIPPEITISEDAPERLRDPLRLFARIVKEPGLVRDRDVAMACRVVAEWAEANSKGVTAVAYAEVAARLLPADPEMANLAGRACRRAGERQRAELWYERGAGLARRADNALEHTNGLLGFGNLYRDEGDFGRAFIWIRRAGRAARRGGLRESAAEALHDAFFVSYVQDNLLRAAAWAERAAKVYPVHAARLPYFAADLSLLLGRNALYREAIAILDAVGEHLTAPVERLQIYAILAWVTGGAKDKVGFSQALGRVREMADGLPYASGAALAYSAAGAQHLGEWELAEELIREAATRIDDALAARLAARVHADIRARAPGAPQATDSHPALRSLAFIAEKVEYRVRRWRGPTWRPRRA